MVSLFSTDMPSNVMKQKQTESIQDIDDSVGSIDQIVAMFHLEKHYYSPVHDYLSQTAPKSGMINRGHRKTMHEWALPIIDHFKFTHKVAFVFMHYLDKATERRLRKTGHRYVSHRDFQLIGLTSLYLAVKLYGQQVNAINDDCTEKGAVVVAIETFVSLGQEQGFTKKEVENMECEILANLNWLVHPPTPLCYLDLLVNLLPASWSSIYIQSDLTVAEFTFALAVCLTELTLNDATCTFHFGASEIAFAAINCAVDALQDMLDSKPCALPCKVKPAPREVGITLLVLLADELSMEVKKILHLPSKLKVLFTLSKPSILQKQCSIPEDLITHVSLLWNSQCEHLPACFADDLPVSEDFVPISTKPTNRSKLVMSPTSCEEMDVLDLDSAVFDMYLSGDGAFYESIGWNLDLHELDSDNDGNRDNVNDTNGAIVVTDDEDNGSNHGTTLHESNKRKCKDVESDDRRKKKRHDNDTKA